MSKWVYLQRKLPRTWRRVAVVVVFVNVLLLVAHNAFFTFHAVTGQPRVLGYYCDSFKRCGGWADRQKGIVNAYVMAAILGLEFKIYMPVPCDLSFFLGPRDEDWRLEPGELDSGSVTWFPLTSYERQSEFAKEFAASKDPLELFSGTQYILITTNVELVQFLRQNRLASRLKWLVELSLPEIYREVLARLFVPMPGPQLVLDVFRDSQPPGTKLVCAQIRMGGSWDSEYFNTMDQFQGLNRFLQPYNNTRTYRIMFTSDSPAMLEAARRNYSEVSIQINGPVTHVDRSMGVDACGGFGHAITEQLALSSCHVLVISESGMGKIAAFMRNTDTDLYIYHDGVVEKFRRNMSFPTESIGDLAFVEGLTQAEAEELRDAFSLFDKNGDNQISKDELGNVMRALGQNPTKKQVEDMMAEADTDDSGYLCYDEYVQIINKHMTPVQDVKIQLEQAFLVFDRDKSGYLNLEELREVLCSMGEPLTYKEAQQVLDAVDVNHDGKVSRSEFVEFLCTRI